MSAKIYLKLDGINGDVEDIAHKGWIEVQSFDFSSSRDVSQKSGSEQRTITSPTISKIILTKKLDKSTPYLFTSSLSETGKTGTIHHLRGGEKPTVYMEHILKNAIISKHHITDIVGSDEAHENIEISFTRIESTYTSFDTTGKAVSNTSAGYDVSKATSL